MKLGIIRTARRTATIIYIPAVPIDDVDFPIKIPNTPKSKSPNVVFWNPIFPSTGRSIAGKNDNKSPLTNDPTIAPFFPPVAFP